MTTRGLVASRDTAPQLSWERGKSKFAVDSDFVTGEVSQESHTVRSSWSPSSHNARARHGTAPRRSGGRGARACVCAARARGRRMGEKGETGGTRVRAARCRRRVSECVSPRGEEAKKRLASRRRSEDAKKRLASRRRREDAKKRLASRRRSEEEKKRRRRRAAPVPRSAAAPPSTSAPYRCNCTLRLQSHLGLGTSRRLRGPATAWYHHHTTTWRRTNGLTATTASRPLPSRGSAASPLRRPRGRCCRRAPLPPLPSATSARPLPSRGSAASASHRDDRAAAAVAHRCLC